MLRFLHAADLHLDSPLRDLEKYEGAPAEAIRGASRKALQNLVQLAIAQRVHFVIIAGDVYDGDWQDVSTGLFFIQQMARLLEAKIPVFLMSGNHDAASRISRNLREPANVQRFPHEQPKTFELKDIQVALHGQSYAEQKETRNLAAAYPVPVSGAFNIGVLHTALDGREGHEPYAPCSVEELIACGYDYWALGHVHQRESVNGTKHPRIEYPGIIQGRHIREEDAKGCLLVTVNERRVITTEFHALDVFRWRRLRVDCTRIETQDDIGNAVLAELEETLPIAEDRSLAVRIELFGACPLHDQLLAEIKALRDDLRARGLSLGQDKVWIEKVQVHTSRPVDLVSTAEVGEDALSEIAQVVTELAANPEELKSLMELDDFKTLAGRLPAELKQGETPLNVADGEWAKSLLDRARAILTQTATRQEAAS